MINDNYPGDASYYSGLLNREELPSDVPNVSILDSTLREGEQSVGISFSKRQRLQIAWMLDYFGVDSIEVSPVISESHLESLKEMKKAGFSAQIVSHGRALASDIDVALSCDVEWVAMYHSVSDIHLRNKLHVSREEALARSIRAVEYAKSHGLKLRFTLEDASRANPEYLSHFISEVTSAGADRIGIPDTVGVMLPRGMKRLVRLAKDATDLPIDVHCHNDLGLALANSLASVEAGADQIHVTIDGCGERVGIASLAEVTMALRLLYDMNRPFRYEMLSELSSLIASYSNAQVPSNKPLVGKNAYTHKAGTHLAAIIQNPETYELIPPKAVGNSRRVVFGELSGKNGAAFLMKTLGLEPTLESSQKLARGLKNLRVGDLFELGLTDKMEAEAVSITENLAAAAPKN
ncbi:MAG TPA: 2-isopropylmalate synthase [Nitrososphaerales archaeon]|nr:2-isopropylmalate synthase [Nitrososphaerales archaeon]